MESNQAKCRLGGYKRQTLVAVVLGRFSLRRHRRRLRVWVQTNGVTSAAKWQVN